MADEIAVNLQEVQAEVSKLSNDELVQELTKVRVRQKTQQKKHYNPERQKAYQLKGREKAKQMKERALAMPATQAGFSNLWEQIEAAAEQQAEKDVTSEAAAE